MIFKHLLPLVLLTGVHVPAALASSDLLCSPSWKLVSDQLWMCDNLAFLSPGNDSRVNLQLLLDADGRLRMNRAPQAEGDYEEGYGLVPFTLRMLDPRRRVDTEDAATTATDPATAALQADLKQLGIDTPLPTRELQLAEGEGSRCRSNDLPSARLFVAALAASKELPPEERRVLAEARLNLLGRCGPDEAPAQLLAAEQLHSPQARDFARYLEGAEAFYRGDFASAQGAFVSLADSQQPWLRETARYLSGRVALNQAQAEAFDEYGFFALDKVDRTSLAASEQAFAAYLADYPQGRYAASARGLLRRLYWLGGDGRRLAAAFAEAFASDADQAGLLALIDELDAKLLPNLASDELQDPRLLAMLDLIRLRDPQGQSQAPLELAELQAQQPRFTSHPGLHAYLVAAWHFYRGNAPQAALDALPAPSAGALDFIAFSQETLRGLALEALGRGEQAEEHWRALLAHTQDPLQQAQLQLALALNLERRGQLATVFAADSPIRSAPIRERLLAYGAGPELLRRQASDRQAAPSERATALYTLLYRELSRGRYAEFLTDLELLAEQPAAPAKAPDPQLFVWAGGNDAGYACPALAEVARRLVADPEDAQGLLCLGDFLRTKRLDQHWLDQPPEAGELGSAPSQFPGTPRSRLMGYQQLLDNPQSSREERAYALFRAINCYAPSAINGCDDQDIDKEQRRQWFQTLKRQYADTPWAQRLKYYW
ncbi:hypothetical protein [Zestomonas thermotolerans]|uniref:hypothetical protein n=1 Tax=Zestomonas thermotolerans TaxID=157784 RepID=UPI0023F01455|nr:hypothetical protein [Pseudomonas thermotolerans]